LLADQHGLQPRRARRPPTHPQPRSTNRGGLTQGNSSVCLAVRKPQPTRIGRRAWGYPGHCDRLSLHVGRLRSVNWRMPSDSVQRGGPATHRSRGDVVRSVMLPVVRAPTSRRDRSAGRARSGRWLAEKTPVRNRAPGSSRSARAVATGPERALSRRWRRDPGGASSVRTTHRIGRPVPRGSRCYSFSVSAPRLPYEYCRTISACVGRAEWLHLGEISRTSATESGPLSTEYQRCQCHLGEFDRLTLFT